ncbi:MAG: DUF3501 family protein [Acidimicrobiia bacterium]
MNAATSRRLTLDDIADLRAYERERAEFRQHVIALKRRRRVAVGPYVTLLFENRDTIRFQIQEMARVEKIISDEGIQNELDAYNPLIPEPGHLSATMFIELTSEALLREWLPKLVGIERTLSLVLADGTEVAATVEGGHAEQLTRDDITASVHYIEWSFAPAQIEAFAEGGATLRCAHPAYRESTPLGPETVAELAADLRG